MKNGQYYSDCMAACHRCATVCEQCAAACLHELNVAELTACIALDLDCAQACTLAASFMARSSSRSYIACGFCAAICRQCAAQCELHDMDHCRDCALACLACAAICDSVNVESADPMQASLPV